MQSESAAPETGCDAAKRVRYGISVSTGHRSDLRKDLERSRRAEELGFDSVWMQDAQLLWKDCIGSMTLTAASTSRITVGSSVLSTENRHPTVVASAMNTLQSLAPGRVILGLGTGAGLGYLMNMRSTTRAKLRHDVEMIRTLMDGGWWTFDGKQARLLEAEGRVPIYIAAGGPKMAELAGEIADGVLFGGETIESLQQRLESLRRGLERSGRTIDDIVVGMALHTCMTDDIERVLPDIKPLCCHLGDYRTMGLDIPVEDLPDVFPPSPRHWEDHEAAVRAASTVVSDEVALQFTQQRGLFGTIDEFDRRIDRLTALGVTHFELKHAIKNAAPSKIDGFVYDMMDAFAERILARASR